jgi:predicted aspartyl protease
MIVGTMNLDRQPVVRLSARGADGRDHEIEAVVDTGFNGSLTLPISTIVTLGLAWRSRGQARLADGSLQDFDIYAGSVLWDGRLRCILIEAAEMDPLMGMSLLYGHDLHIRVVDGGPVTIQAVP